MKKQIVSVLLPAAAVLALNAGPVWGQSSGASGEPGSSRQTGQSSTDPSVGGTQSQRTKDADPSVAPHSEIAPDKPGSASRGSGNRSQASGMSGQQDIREAQQALKAQGHDPGPIDGLMGPQTRQALREFQSSNGLQQTGMLDAQTKDKLNIENSSNKGSGSMGRSDSSTRQKGSSPSGR